MTNPRIVDLAAKAKRLKPRPDDNQPALVLIDESKGYFAGNVAVISKPAERVLKRCTAEERAAVMRAVKAQRERPNNERPRSR